MTKPTTATTQLRSQEVVADNADKYILAESIPTDFLDRHNAASTKLTVDWLDIGDDSETKVARKEFIKPEQPVQILLIEKVVKDGHRTAKKRPITEEEYSSLKAKSICHLAKVRYEFEYTNFSLKYDVFNEHDQIIEVDGASAEQRASFDANLFPYKLSPIAGIDGPAAVDWLRQRQSDRS